MVPQGPVRVRVRCFVVRVGVRARVREACWGRPHPPAYEQGWVRVAAKVRVRGQLCWPLLMRNVLLVRVGVGS